MKEVVEDGAQGGMGKKMDECRWSRRAERMKIERVREWEESSKNKQKKEHVDKHMDISPLDVSSLP